MASTRKTSHEEMISRAKFGAYLQICFAGFLREEERREKGVSMIDSNGMIFLALVLSINLKFP